MHIHEFLILPFITAGIFAFYSVKCSIFSQALASWCMGPVLLSNRLLPARWIYEGNQGKLSFFTFGFSVGRWCSNQCWGEWPTTALLAALFVLRVIF